MVFRQGVYRGLGIALGVGRSFFESSGLHNQISASQNGIRSTSLLHAFRTWRDDRPLLTIVDDKMRLKVSVSHRQHVGASSVLKMSAWPNDSGFKMLNSTACIEPPSRVSGDAQPYCRRL